MPSETDITVTNRSKIYKNEIFSDDEEAPPDELELVGSENMENLDFMQVIHREKGTRINLVLPHPKNQLNEKHVKFYLKNSDYDTMVQKLRSHKDVIIMIDGSSKNNPGMSGIGIW